MRWLFWLSLKLQESWLTWLIQREQHRTGRNQKHIHVKVRLFRFRFWRRKRKRNMKVKALGMRRDKVRLLLIRFAIGARTE